SHGSKDILQVGFTASGTHHIVPIDRCPILTPGLAGAIEAAWAIAETLGGAKPLDIQATATDAGLDIDVRGSGPLNATQSVALARLAESRRLARLTRHGELVARRSQPTIRMGRATVPLPPGAFLQATAAGEEALARLVAVVFDPPRQGAEAQARALAASKVPVVVAVSCNPATFARDVKILIDGGYRLTAVTPVDQFRYSAHVEIVARLVR